MIDITIQLTKSLKFARTTQIQM